MWNIVDPMTLLIVLLFSVLLGPGIVGTYRVLKEESRARRRRPRRARTHAQAELTYDYTQAA